MNVVLHGTVRGRTVELDRDPGIEENRVVEVILRTKQLPGPPPAWEPGSKETTAGMLANAWTPEDDRILIEINEDRRRSAFREAPE
ncbi:MAG: hypothetical protein GX594_01345 [Pirellulaceae bacterium]|nr:hypothetical protein [Pirellulaceae bacterium]